MMKISKFPFASAITAGLVVLLLGILLVAVPDFTLSTIVRIIGIAVCFGALIMIWMYLKTDRKKKMMNVFYIVGAAINLCFGLVLAINPTIFETFLMIIIGALLVLSGIVISVMIFKFRPMTTLAKVLFAASLLAVVCGIIIIFDPIQSQNVIAAIVGTMFIFVGLIALISIIWIRSQMRKAMHTGMHEMTTVEIEEAVAVDDDTQAEQQ